MQAEQDTLSSSARSISNEFSRPHSQALAGSWLGDQNVDIYFGSPDPNAYMHLGYNDGRDSQYVLRNLN